MTRTTIDLDPAVLRQLRERSERERKSMGQIASELLVSALAVTEPTVATPLAWVSRDLGQPTLDLEDREAVRAILDRR